MRLLLALVLVVGSTIVLVSCGEKSDTTSVKTESAAAIPPTLMASAAPSGARELAAVKGSVKDGEEVVLRARVGGTERPLAENRAIITVADLSLPTCDKNAGDNCKTPWDSCCEPREVLTAKTATVEVVGADGKPLHATLNGVGGIAAGKELLVTGTAKTTADTLVVQAKQIYVVP